MRANESFHFDHLVADRLRQLRLERNWTLDDVATRAREVGLGWDWAAVASIERLTRALQAHEFVALPLVFGIELKDLFEAEDVAGVSSGSFVVGIGEEGLLNYDTLRAILSGKANTVRRDATVTPATIDVVAALPAASPSTGRTGTVQSTAGATSRITGTTTFTGVARSTPRRAVDAFKSRARQLWPRATRAQIASSLNDSEKLAEQKAARRFGIEARELSLIAHAVWGRGLSVERDHRLLMRVGADTPTRTVQALRGHITRELLTELEPAIKSKVRRKGR